MVQSFPHGSKKPEVVDDELPGARRAMPKLSGKLKASQTKHNDWATLGVSPIVYGAFLVFFAFCFFVFKPHFDLRTSLNTVSVAANQLPQTHDSKTNIIISQFVLFDYSFYRVSRCPGWSATAWILLAHCHLSVSSSKDSPTPAPK